MNELSWQWDGMWVVNWEEMFQSFHDRKLEIKKKQQQAYRKLS